MLGICFANLSYVVSLKSLLLGWEDLMARTNLQEKRAHRRLDIRLPLEYRKEGAPRRSVFRTTTLNVSTGGLYFETAAQNIRVGETYAFELGIPATDERFPIQGKIVASARIVRTTPLDDEPNHDGLVLARFGVAAQFDSGFRLTLLPG